MDGDITITEEELSESYTQIAYEQRECDIERTCEWLNEHLPYGAAFNDDGIIENVTIDTLIEKYREDNR